MHAHFEGYYQNFRMRNQDGKELVIELPIPQRLITLDQLEQLIVSIRLLPRFFGEETLSHKLREELFVVNKQFTSMKNSADMDAMSNWDKKGVPPLMPSELDEFYQNKEWGWVVSFDLRHLTSNDALGAVRLMCHTMASLFNTHDSYEDDF